MKRLFGLLAGLVLAGCTAGPPAPAPAAGGWQEISVPASGARVLELVALEDELLVLGSVPGPEGRAPAAWTTTNGEDWRAVPLEPHSGYADQAELVSAGVAGGDVVVLGRAFGGAHGNPRMTIWSGGAHGLAEHPQPFEMFGGPSAVAVTAAAATPGRFLLVGQWDAASHRSGATVWISPDGASWDRHADDPVLASAPGEQTSATGAAGGQAGFVVTGHTQRGVKLFPLAWTSSEGRNWQRIEIPADTSATANRAACDGTGCVLLGLATTKRWHALCWPLNAGAAVGPARPGPEGSTVDISQAVLDGGRAYAALRVDGTARLASVGRDCTGWQDIVLPVSVREVRVAALAGGLLLATTGEHESRLWLRRGIS